MFSARIMLLFVGLNTLPVWSYSMNNNNQAEIQIENARYPLQERLIKAALQYTLMHHNNLMIKYDIKNLYSHPRRSCIIVPRHIADYSLISAILISMSLITDLSELSSLLRQNPDKAKKIFAEIDQKFTQSIGTRGPWIINTNGYNDSRQGKSVFANCLYTLRNFDQLMHETYTYNINTFLHQPLCSKLMWYSHSKMVSNSMVYPDLLELITARPTPTIN